MRKLIFILIVFCNKADAQLSVNKIFLGASTTTTDASGIGSGNKTFTVGRLYLWMISTTGTTNPGTTSSPSYTWTSIVSTGNSTRRIQIFATIATSTQTEQVATGTFGGGSTGYTTSLWEVTGFDNTSGLASAIPNTTTGGATGSDPTLTLSSIVNRSMTVYWFFNDASPFGGTEESGWTEDFDGGYSTPTAGTYIMSRQNATDNTPTVTASSSTWIGVAFEIRAGGRRATIIN